MAGPLERHRLKGVHAMIPKSIFSDDLRQTISIV
jgi:hypothetical protein